MTPRQRIELAQSKRRQRLSELLAIEERSDDETAELARITDVEMPQGEVELRAAIAADDDPAPAVDGITEPVVGIDPKRVELRNASSLAAFVSAAISGRPLSGAEAELAAEVNLGTGFVPLEMFTPPAKPAGDVETRAVSAAPSDVGVNLAPILPSIFARAVAGRLGVEMPRVPTGTYATGTITGDLTATAKGKTEAAGATSATITTATTTPHRISARLAVALEDIAAVGTDNFEASLRQNLSLVLSAKLDEYALRGTGQGVHPRGLMPALDAPAAAPATVVDWLGFVKAVTGGIDGGPWAEDTSAGGSTNKATNTDPCKAWNEATINALHNSRPVTPAPSGCGRSTAEVQAALNAWVSAYGRTAAQFWSEVFGDWLEATEGNARHSKAEREAMIAEYKRAWNELPPPAKTAAKATYCTAVVALAVADMEPTTKVALAALAADVGCTVALEHGPDALRNDGASDNRDSTPDATPDDTSTPREGGTAAARPQPDSDTSGDADAAEAKKSPTLAEIAKAQADGVPRAQLEAMKNQWRCANGHPSFCQ